jgi:hypothetical protein
MTVLELFVAPLGTLGFIGQIYIYLAYSKPGIPFGTGQWLLWGLTMTNLVG